MYVISMCTPDQEHTCMCMCTCAVMYVLTLNLPLMRVRVYIVFAAMSGIHQSKAKQMEALKADS